ncbi:hypothetical protein niasHT_030582 [Heterodera trifolii]|uniref:Ubiquitin-like domain-containing protein n=1 Tax=Heterodera trifolii TaxID=157864 RepID=A0ABD2J273_9BILA
MQLFVRNLIGKTVVVETDQQFGTVRSIKEQIEQIEGIRTDDQILIFAGHILHDDQKLASNCSSSAGDLSSGSAIHLSLRLNGGEIVMLGFPCVRQIAENAVHPISENEKQCCQSLYKWITFYC